METTQAPVVPPPVINPTAPAPTTGASDRYVGFVPRLVAALIDGILVGIVTGVLTATMKDMDSTKNSVSILIGASYSIFMWVGNNGQTLGKKAMGIRVVQVDGQPLNYKTAILRYVGYYVSGVVLLLGYIWVMFDPKKQGWHDKIANTYVVKQ